MERPSVPTKSGKVNVLSSVSFSVVIPAVILGCVVLSTPTLRTSMIKIIVMAFSIYELGQYNKNKERGKMFAILGLIFLGLAILLSVVFWSELFTMKILR